MKILRVLDPVAFAAAILVLCVGGIYLIYSSVRMSIEIEAAAKASGGLTRIDWMQMILLGASVFVLLGVVAVLIRSAVYYFRRRALQA